MTDEHLDILIVGAGLSGISAAYYLQTRCPNKRYAILEARSTMGGTWDLFRYPGVRSDSDMHTLGYSFRPWRTADIIGEGPAIRAYLCETARQFGVDRHIRFNHRVQRADWSSEQAKWTVTVEGGPERQAVTLTCNFLYMCSGYYAYDQGYAPTWPGLERFGGRLVHPQHWPQDLEYGGQQVVVIGSGATAVTLVPAMAGRAAHVTMLQRSPSYVIALPGHDRWAERLYRYLPDRLALGLVRWKSILVGLFFYLAARRWPGAVRRLLLSRVQAELGPGFDVETHFAPHYNPWDQRVCLAPDADLFAAIRSGRATVVTDTIETFTETGIRLRSGQELPADLVVTATGLVLKLLGGVQLCVDGAVVDLGQRLTYRGVMYQDIPNLASAFGYTNASWTLKCELIAQYVCRLLNTMDRHGYVQCTPRQRQPGMPNAPILDFTSGYVQRGLAGLPRQGPHRPWRMDQNYVLDLFNLRFNRLEDGVLEFARPGGVK